MRCDVYIRIYILDQVHYISGVKKGAEQGDILQHDFISGKREERKRGGGESEKKRGKGRGHHAPQTSFHPLFFLLINAE